MTRRTIAGIAVLLVPIALMLGSFTLAYYLWPEAMVVQGRASTGGTGAVWFFRSCDDPETEGKDVGAWSVAPADREQKTLQVTISNGYPGYEVYCELHLANSAAFPLKVTSVSVINPNPQALTVTAQEDPAQAGKVLQPCGSTPAWGTTPAHVPARCRTEIQLTLHIEQGAAPKSSYGFTIEVKLEQTP